MRPGLAVLLGFSLTMEEFKPFAEIACSCYQKYLCYSLSYVSNMWVADDSQEKKANISYIRHPPFNEQDLLFSLAIRYQSRDIILQYYC